MHVFLILEAAATWGKLFHGGQQKDKRPSQNTQAHFKTGEMRPEKSLLIHCQPWDAKWQRAKTLGLGIRPHPRKVRARRNHEHTTLWISGAAGGP